VLFISKIVVGRSHLWKLMCTVTEYYKDEVVQLFSNKALQSPSHRKHPTELLISLLLYKHGEYAETLWIPVVPDACCCYW